ncbi:MAG: sensor histidine kinase [Chitinophagaceae bacterium]
MNKLLNRTLLYYTVFASIVLLLSSPLFYFMMEKLYIDDVDEAIMLRKKEFLLKSRATLQTADINVWNRFNRDIRILADTTSTKPKDKIIQEVFYDEMTPEWEPYRVLYTDVAIHKQRYVLMIRLNLVESQDLILTLTWLYCFVLFTLLIVIFFATRFISNRLWKPFHDTLDKIGQFNIEHSSLPDFAKTPIVEFVQLNKGLSELIKNNLKAYQNQKEFTENAAHELQTPLAVFQSKLDMLLQDPSLNDSQAIILQSLYEASSRLSRVNKNLLLLAKIENNQFTLSEPVHTKTLIEEVLPYFTEQALSRNLTIDANITDAPVVNAAKSLAEIMINNLLLNAITHNRMNGSISIKATQNEIIICNTSDQQQLNTENLFKRFGKISRASHNSGLGLAIIKQICQLHSWQVSYQYHLDRHCFSIIF